MVKKYTKGGKYNNELSQQLHFSQNNCYSLNINVGINTAIITLYCGITIFSPKNRGFLLNK